ncbi:hypothetical protein CDL15_Pgr022944 [Punica granatum]|uniref:C2 NT-type domain-containing protein n=1 Tax=Punica granatum TaxID=22663 RepID=A0A218X596_PUNGR|nr:hypothetical protein CDL15_Pgr022944 [Punica granatum]
MFKSWKSDKSKIKAVFRLQFQATQVPKLKKPTLTVSLMPDNAGKPTVKLEKAVVQDGTCAWEHPVYETVKLIRESKTGKIHEKIYHFIVSAGSSKSGFLGEASIDFADFAEETKPVTLSLPLKFANSGAILHVTIQNMQGADQRELEEYGDPISTNDKSLMNQLSNCSTDDNSQHNYLDDEQFDESFQQDLERSLGPWNGQGEVEAVPKQNSGPPRRSFGTMLTKNNTHRRSQTEWSLGSASDGSFGDSMNNGDAHVPRERLRESPNNYIEKLKNEIDTLTKQSTLSELELQSLRKQVVKETKRGQSLSMEVNSLKEERDMLKKQCEELQSPTLDYEKAENLRALQIENEETKAQLDELRYEFDHEKELKANLRLQLQKTQDSNSELILELADLEEVVKEKNREISSLSLKIQNYKDLEEIEKRKSKYNMNAEGKARLQQELSEGHDGVEVSKLKQKIVELSNEIEVCKKQKAELETHLEQLTLDWEILKRENADISTKLEEMNLQEDLNEQMECPRCRGSIREREAQIEKLEEVVKKQEEELSESLISINELEIQLRGLEKEMDQQAREFEQELDAMTRAKIEQEQRAIGAEEALRKTRWKNAVAAERLQEEFKRLSVEMTSKFDENEKMAAKAVAESDELRQQKRTLEEMLQKANEEVRLVTDQNAVKLRDLYDQIASRAMQIEQMSAQLDSKAQQLEHSQQENERISKAFSMEIQKLSSEIENLRTENCELKEQCEEMAKVREDTERADREMRIQRWNAERDDLQRKFASVKKDAEEAGKELISMRSLKEEKEKVLENLESEVQSLLAQQNDLKQNLLKEEVEKENLRKQIHKLQSELRSREEKNTITERKLMNNCNQKQSNSSHCYQNAVATLKGKVGLLKEQIGLNSSAEASASSSGNEDGLKDIIKELERSMAHLRLCNFSADKSKKGVKSAASGDSEASLKRQEEACSEKGSQQSTSNTNDNCNINELLAALKVFKERNKLMEKELKDMEERYSEISLRFAEVEGERQQLVMTVRNLKNSMKS